MNSNTNSPKLGRQAPTVTKAAGQGSTSTRLVASQPYKQNQPPRSNVLSDQAERQPSSYNLNRWLHQIPQDDPWNAQSRDGGQNSDGIESKRAKVDGENRNEGETRLEGGERFASFDDRRPIKLIVALGVESAEG
ncbi:MAG: hypothetical protein HETSPECPRED_009482 [Heterodermia speciosa]|uniref:Uncharacterized protein n=1 Tax=Heterodermia speciosa TaxID=116794 RepID=A0A8H3IB12_9LECA|nr:MAG: hypothetical protein HETSPECPRED_009482 [Heterodermia speciosa]